MKNEYSQDVDAHFNIRCSKKLREDAEKIAVTKGQSLAEWIRRAIQEKIERDMSGSPDDFELDERIEKAIRKIMSEQK